MGRWGLLLIALPILAGACAAPEAFVVAAPPEDFVELPATPARDYEAGALNVVRGDYAAARRDFDRCLATSSPASAARLDCLVAREQLAGRIAREP